jgi:hypothetical protein
MQSILQRKGIEGISPIAHNTTNNPYPAAVLILATRSSSLFTIRKIMLTARITGNMYSITPNKPNISHLIPLPNVPAILKLLNTIIIAQAIEKRIIQSFFN